jgi:hypothetical protein
MPNEPQYASDSNNPSMNVDNVEERYVRRNLVNQTPEIPLYPSSAQFGGDTLDNPTDTIGDFTMTCNAMLEEIWELSRRLPGIYQTMDATTAPEDPSAGGANITENEVQYLAQLQSLKYNDFRRNFQFILRYMKRLRDNIDGAVGESGDQAPSALDSGRYPSDQARGY